MSDIFGRMVRLVPLVMVAGGLTVGVSGVAEAAKPAVVTVCSTGCDYSTIQSAVDHVPNGARIRIAAGTYGSFAVPGANSHLMSVTLQGSGAGLTTVQGGGDSGPASGPVVSIDSGVAVSLSGVSVTNNRDVSYAGDGGGIANRGMLELKNSSVSNSLAVGPGGGGIVNSGTLAMQGTTVTGNNAVLGGGIYNEAGGTATIKDSTIGSNFAQTAGGVYNEGGATMTLAGTTVTGNSVTYSGHGIYNDGTLRVASSTVSQNGGYGDLGSSGGGIYNTGILTVSGSAVTDNVTGNVAIPQNSRGGGIYNSGTATLTSSSVTDNSATGEGGGIHNAGTVSLRRTVVTNNDPDNCAPLGTVPGCTG